MLPCILVLPVLEHTVVNQYRKATWLRNPAMHEQRALCGWTAVKQNDNPTDEQVAETHGRVVKALENLYETHKHLIPGWENKPLHVV